jgi:hypothetical protein
LGLSHHQWPSFVSVSILAIDCIAKLHARADAEERMTLHLP